MIERMTLRHKIGQRLIGGFPSTTMSQAFIQAVRDYKVANVVLFKHNIESSRQLYKLCQDIQALVKQETGYPAFITIDQEGGVVTRLSSDATNVPGAMALASTGNPDYACRMGLITGRELRALGVNFNLAPTLDINSNPNNPVIGTRSYGDTAETVCRYGMATLKGLMEAGIIATAKHFPGHGDTYVDSHIGLPEVNKSLEALEYMELKTFKAAIEAGIPAIMTSHILYPQIEKKKLPATMSHTIVTGLLKERMGFKGLVLSDCMEMNAIKANYGTVRGVVTAMGAGVDLIFLSHTTSLLSEVSEAVEQALLSGELKHKEMDASVEKILDYKAKYAIEEPANLSCVGCIEHQKEVEEVMAKTITAVQIPLTGQPDLGKNPYFLGCQPYRSTQASSSVDQSISFARFMVQQFGGEGLDTSVNPTSEEINRLTKKAEGHSCLVMATYNGHLNRGQIELIRALAQTTLPIIVIALRNPYDLKDLPYHVCAFAGYEYTDLSLRAIAKVLAKEKEATGRLSVKL